MMENDGYLMMIIIMDDDLKNMVNDGLFNHSIIIMKYIRL